MESVMDMFGTAFGKDTLGRISSWLGESPAATKAAVEDAIPVSMVGVADQASTDEGSRALLAHVQRGDYPHIQPEELSDTVTDPAATGRLVDASQGFMGGLFGGKLGSVVDGISRHSGASHGGTSKLLGLAGPLVMGMITKRTMSDHLDAGGLRRYLGEQRSIAAGLLPAPLASLLTPAGAAATTRVGAAERLQRRPEVVERRRAFPWWILGLLAVLALVAFAVSRIGRREATRPTAAVTAPMSAPTARLSDGDVSALTRSLQSEGSLPQRFLFDVHFATSSPEIEQGSRALLDQVAGALSAHPTARIRLEGHTDATGRPEVNRQLSLARAEATKAYLTEHGVDGARIETAGYGPDRPVASNDDPAGQAQNRRTELVLLSR